MLSRRSMFSLFAGVGAIAAGAKVVEATPALPNLPPMPAPSKPHLLWTAELPSHSHGPLLTDPAHTHGFSGVAVTSPYQAQGSMFPRGVLVSGGGLVPSVSDGEGRIVPVESPEGQTILKSIAAPHAGMSRW